MAGGATPASPYVPFFRLISVVDRGYVLIAATAELRRRLDDELHVGPLPGDVLCDPVLLLSLLHRCPHSPLRPRLRTVRAQVRKGLGQVLLDRQVQIRPWRVLDGPLLTRLPCLLAHLHLHFTPRRWALVRDSNKR